jgi:SAM-dependent methyltransferase
LGHGEKGRLYMEYTKEQIYRMMKDDKYPLSSKYDCDWIIENEMGSNCLCLLEELTWIMELKADMRILDMGCGKALSSIFLAREFGTRVWATDLWISASDNFKRIREMNVEDKVCPIHADAHDLPFADNYFDAMVSINSIFLYVTDEEFLKKHLFCHVKPGGEIGIIVPGFLHEYMEGIPEEFEPFWINNLDHWHTLEWWIDILNKSGEVDIILADTFPDNGGNKLYRKDTMIFNTHNSPLHVFAIDNFAFFRILVKRKNKIR